ncbi:hypothetical protein RRG08_040434 [Elysia crispata]|uniref:Uncharacterized protein n=1 Tax=Elysia crispata TaxID=231223 RepID=A0AAE0ZCK7_9GAST|nr:hypothetical protein RRG08_040434 [Elysia crispata]
MFPRVFPSPKVVFVFVCHFSEGVNGSLVLCIADGVPTCLSAISRAVRKCLVNEFGELFPKFLLHPSLCVDAGTALLLGAVELPGAETHLAADQGVIGVAVGTVVAAPERHLVQHGFLYDDKVQLVPVLRSGMSSGHSMVWLGGQEGVSDLEVVE